MLAVRSAPQLLSQLLRQSLPWKLETRSPMGILLALMGQAAYGAEGTLSK